MKTYGYCRISTPKQNIDRQIRNILAAHPDAVLIRETYTGATSDRPEWKKLEKKLRSGDTIVFDSVSRMSRDSEDGFRMYKDLFSRGISLEFLKEPHINTETYRAASDSSLSMTGTDVDLILEGVNRYMLRLAEKQIRLAFQQSEKEVEDLRQRTREGIETARIDGKQIGRCSGDGFETRKAEKAKEIIKKHCKAFGGSLSDPEVITLSGISRNSFYKYKKEICRELFDLK